VVRVREVIVVSLGLVVVVLLEAVGVLVQEAVLVEAVLPEVQVRESAQV
jgi:hypothetical protein